MLSSISTRRFRAPILPRRKRRLLPPGKGLHFVPPEGTPADVAKTQRSLSVARTSTLSDALSAEGQVARLRDTLPILDRQIDNTNRLDA